MSRGCQLRNPAISDTVCQVTHGSEGWWADTDYAQWLKAEVEKRGWQKQDLAAAVLAADQIGRLGEAGAEALVRRASHGGTPKAANQELLDAVLGHMVQGHPESVEAQVLRLTQDVRRLTRRVAALEHRARPQSDQEGSNG